MESEVINEIIRFLTGEKFLKIICFPIFIVCSIILLLPDEILSKLWLSDIDENIMIWIGISFVLSGIGFIKLISVYIKRATNKRQKLKTKIGYLKEFLDKVEHICFVASFYDTSNKIFKEFIIVSTNNIFTSDRFNGLEREGIIDNSYYLNDGTGRIHYSLNKDVRKYLNVGLKFGFIKVKENILIFKK